MSTALSAGITVTQRATGNVVTSNTLAASGDVWTISQVGTVHLVATAPVMVVQYIPAAGGSNYAFMTLVFPSDKWLSSYLVWALDSPTTGTQLASLAMLTAQVSKLTATRLTDGADVTSLLTFTAFTGSDFSTASLSLSDSSAIQLTTTDTATSFQVLQYGGISGTDGAYAFPSGALITCQDISTSSSTPTSSGSSRIVSFLPNPALFVVLAVSTIAVFGAVAEAVRRWKLGANGKQFSDAHSNSFEKRHTTESEEFKSTVSDQEKYPMDHFSPQRPFRSKAPVDSSYIQVKPYIPR
ncbi:hypothetical protein ElyMa_001991100 [Elysia marginata]|uniref:Transmembrane protein n=1 Tax=Elysia marginata TaxID=1093978 RepID=A0AAV4F317_9GAST|nr:hypothetical protein ElyMa_001991100 [Elysia marginata]